MGMAKEVDTWVFWAGVGQRMQKRIQGRRGEEDIETQARMGLGYRMALSHPHLWRRAGRQGYRPREACLERQGAWPRLLGPDSVERARSGGIHAKQHGWVTRGRPLLRVGNTASRSEAPHHWNEGFQCPKLGIESKRMGSAAQRAVLTVLLWGHLGLGTTTQTCGV